MAQYPATFPIGRFSQKSYTVSDNLQNKLDEANERIRQLEKELCPDLSFLPLKLTRREQQILSMIYAHKIASYRAIELAVYHGEGDGLDNLLKVFVNALRRKLRPHGINIVTQYAMGYFMTDEDKVKLGKMING